MGNVCVFMLPNVYICKSLHTCHQLLQLLSLTVSLLSLCICMNNPSSTVNMSPEQKKVCSEEEVPHQVPLCRAAHHQPPTLHEGMHTVFVSV